MLKIDKTPDGVPFIAGHDLFEAIYHSNDSVGWLRRNLERLKLEEGPDFYVTSVLATGRRVKRRHRAEYQLPLGSALALLRVPYYAKTQSIVTDLRDWLTHELELRGDVRFGIPKTPKKETCPKCGAEDGRDWSQCDGVCPMPQSPHYILPPPPADNEATTPSQGLLPLPSDDQGKVWTHEVEAPVAVVAVPGVTVGNLRGVQQAKLLLTEDQLDSADRQDEPDNSATTPDGQKLTPDPVITATTEQAEAERGGPPAPPVDNIPTTPETPAAVLRREFNRVVICQRIADGYMNASAMCAATGSMIGLWSQAPDTKRVLKCLVEISGLPMDRLVETITEGDVEMRGVWVPSRAAMQLAAWSGVMSFFLEVAGWVSEWTILRHTTTAPAPAALQPPQTYAAALRTLADSVEENARLRAETEKAAPELEQEVGTLEYEHHARAAAEQRAAELESEIIEMAASVATAPRTVSLYEFFEMTQHVHGMTIAVGYRMCYELGIIQRPEKDRWGVEEALPCARWAKLGYIGVEQKRPFSMPEVDKETQEKTGRVVMVQRQTTVLYPERINQDGTIKKIGGYEWLMRLLANDERCLLYRLIKEYDGAKGRFGVLYGCQPVWCADRDLPASSKLSHAIIRIYKPRKSRNETHWRAARQIGNKQYLAEGLTQTEALLKLSEMMPAGAPRAFSKVDPES